MNLAVLRSRALCGMEALAVSVEVHLANGLPKLLIVGLPDTEVREAKDRVQAALLNAGFQVPLVNALRRVGSRLRRRRERGFQHRVADIAAAYRISIRQRSEIHVVGNRSA